MTLFAIKNKMWVNCYIITLFKTACVLLSVAAEDVAGVDFLLYIIERAVVAVGDDCL